MSEYFSDVSKIVFEGEDSKNSLAFRHYDPEQEVEGKKMKDHLRVSAQPKSLFLSTKLYQYGRMKDSSGSLKTILPLTN